MDDDLKQVLSALFKRLTDVEDWIKVTNPNVEKMSFHMDLFEKSLKTANELIDRLNKDLSEKDKTIEELEILIKSMKSELSRLKLETSLSKI